MSGILGEGCGKARCRPDNRIGPCGGRIPVHRSLVEASEGLGGGGVVFAPWSGRGRGDPSQRAAALEPASWASGTRPVAPSEAADHTVRHLDTPLLDFFWQPRGAWRGNIHGDLLQPAPETPAQVQCVLWAAGCVAICSQRSLGLVLRWLPFCPPPQYAPPARGLARETCPAGAA